MSDYSYNYGQSTAAPAERQPPGVPLYPANRAPFSFFSEDPPWTVAPQSPGNRDTSSYFSGDPPWTVAPQSPTNRDEFSFSSEDPPWTVAPQSPANRNASSLFSEDPPWTTTPQSPANRDASGFFSEDPQWSVSLIAPANRRASSSFSEHPPVAVISQVWSRSYANAVSSLEARSDTPTHPTSLHSADMTNTSARPQTTESDPSPAAISAVLQRVLDVSEKPLDVLMVDGFIKYLFDPSAPPGEGLISHRSECVFKLVGYTYRPEQPPRQALHWPDMERDPGDFWDGPLPPPKTDAKHQQEMLGGGHHPLPSEPASFSESNYPPLPAALAHYTELQPFPEAAVRPHCTPGTPGTPPTAAGPEVLVVASTPAPAPATVAQPEAGPDPALKEAAEEAPKVVLMPFPAPRPRRGGRQAWVKLDLGHTY